MLSIAETDQLTSPMPSFEMVLDAYNSGNFKRAYVMYKGAAFRGVVLDDGHAYAAILDDSHKHKIIKVVTVHINIDVLSACY